jgi:hypothetical protein
LTLAEFKAYVDDQGNTDTTDDGVMEDIIEAASRYIDRQTNQFFYDDEDATRYYTPEANDFLITDPIQSITTLKTDSDGDRTYEDTWQSTDYDLMPFNPENSSYTWIETTPDGDYSFPKIKKGVEITGDFGYASTPDDIKLACMEIAKAAYSRRYGQNMTGNAEVTAAGVVITPQDIPAFARSIIRGYRRIV